MFLDLVINMVYVVWLQNALFSLSQEESKRKHGLNLKSFVEL